MRYLFIIFLVSFLWACKSNKNTASSAKKESLYQPVFSQGPTTFVYKTKEDYFYNVPVILSSNKEEIISYPHPKDLIKDGQYTTPFKLKNGYLLDIKGINQNVAFLSFTYSEYASFTNVPSIEELYENIVDFNPLETLCNCGNRNYFEDIEKQLNDLIISNQLDVNCKKIL